jgi:hypothetical protein
VHARTYGGWTSLAAGVADGGPFVVRGSGLDGQVVPLA